MRAMQPFLMFFIFWSNAMGNGQKMYITINDLISMLKELGQIPTTPNHHISIHFTKIYIVSDRWNMMYLCSMQK